VTFKTWQSLGQGRSPQTPLIASSAEGRSGSRVWGALSWLCVAFRQVVCIPLHSKVQKEPNTEILKLVQGLRPWQQEAAWGGSGARGKCLSLSMSWSVVEDSVYGVVVLKTLQDAWRAGSVFPAKTVPFWTGWRSHERTQNG